MNVYDFGSHISSRFDSELEELCTQFVEMGSLVERQIADSIHALLDSNLQLAEQVIHKDVDVNALEQKIDTDIELVLAKRQPTAGDLRLILMLSKATTDLERMGDEAVKIARVAKEMFEHGNSPRGYSETRNIANQVRLMIHESLDAFVRFDADQALKVMQADLQIDEEYQSSMRSLLTYIMEDSRFIARIINVMWVLRAIERIGDHARNVAEQVIYVISGQDVRHTHLDDVEKTVQAELKDQILKQELAQQRAEEEQTNNQDEQD